MLLPPRHCCGCVFLFDCIFIWLRGFFYLDFYWWLCWSPPKSLQG